MDLKKIHPTDPTIVPRASEIDIASSLPKSTFPRDLGLPNSLRHLHITSDMISIIHSIWKGSMPWRSQTLHEKNTYVFILNHHRHHHHPWKVLATAKNTGGGSREFEHYRVWPLADWDHHLRHFDRISTQQHQLLVVACQWQWPKMEGREALSNSTCCLPQTKTLTHLT